MAGLDFSLIFIEFIVLLFSLTVHEAAHAFTSDRLGDPTARLLGRVSLNPAVHVDLIGTIIFPLIAMTTGAPVFGWAKPVPVNITRLKGHWKRKYMLIAAAGPASNVVLAFLASPLYHIVPVGGQLAEEATFAPLRTLLRAIVVLNVLLAVFNMVPVPPLDGGNVLAGVLRGPAADMYERLRPYGFMILYGLMFTGVLTMIMSPPAQFLLSVLL